MGCIFISHVEEDSPLAREIAGGLESSGYTTWYYERDTLPGTSYILQIARAMEQCAAVVLLISPRALSSDQVTREVVGAFERGAPFFPVLVDITPEELRERQPEWRHALGGTAMITLGPEGLSKAIAGMLAGLKALDIGPGEEKARSLNPVLSTPKSEAPKHIADRIIASRAAMEGERKQVTVLFAEVTGLSSTSGKLDPEELHDLLRPCLDLMAEEIHRYEGTVAHLTSHGLTALFGAPIAHEDDPRRALDAALDIQRRFEDKADELRAGGLQCELRLGANTGLVIVGRIGDDLSMEYSAIGDTVNLASEIKGAAEPGTVCVSGDTHNLTRGYFDFEEAGEIEVRGVEAPLKVYRVISPRHAATRVEASLAGGLSTFVGRERELEHLSYCLEKAREGQGQVVGVVGEAGVGKSRLIYEFTLSLSEKEHTLLEGGCRHYGEAIAYLPILALLRKYFDIGEEEDQAAIRSKINGKIESFDGQLTGILPPLHDVLSLEVEDKDYLALEPAQRRERVFEALRRLLISERQVKPLVVVIEDLHWIDRTSEEFLSFLIESLGNVHMLLLLLYRPDYSPPWSAKTFFSLIRVDQLPQERSADLVQSILSEGEVAPEIPDLIVGRASGNPLFIEELTHGLLENGSIAKDDEHYVLSLKPTDIEVPDTIQGIIASRLDRLSEDLKSLTQVASVIGREFAYRLLQTITELKEELKSYLSDLQNQEFIYEKSLFPELAYIFKHALTQEVAYESLLLKRRREIHERIGQAIEHIYSDRLEEFHEMLAYHYQRSTDADKAVRYLKLSGDKAARRYANWEAVSFYREAIRILDAQPDTQENERERMEVCLSMIYPLYLLGYPEGSMEILREAEKLSEELGDEGDLAKVYGILARYHSLKGDLSSGVECCERCFDAAEKAGDIDIMATTAFDICVPLYFAGRLVDQGIISGRVISLMEEHHREGDIRAGGLMVYSHQCGWCGHALTLLGEFDEAESVLERGLEHTLEVGDTFGTGWIEEYYGMLSMFKGDPDGIVEHACRSIECFEETGIEFYMGIPWTFMGFGHYMLGELDEARRHGERGVELNIKTGPPLLTPVLESMLALIYLDAGDPESALRSAEEALELSRDYQTKLLEAFALLYLGKVEGEVDPSRIDAATQHIRQGMSLIEEMSCKGFYGLGPLFLGEVCEKAGRGEEAPENLKKAEEIYKDMGLGPKSYWLSRTHEALARLE